MTLHHKKDLHISKISIRQKYLLILVIFAVFCVLLINYPLDFTTGKQYFVSKSLTSNDSSSISQIPKPPTVGKHKVCHFPDLDPWHPSLAAYTIKQNTKVACPQTQPNLTYIDINGLLTLSETQLELLVNELNLETEEKDHNMRVNCFYRTFDRAPGDNDSRIEYSTQRELKSGSPVTLDEDMVEVTCYKSNSNSIEKSINGITEEKVYWNIHAHPAKKAGRIFGKPTDSKLSILMLGIDSLSFSHFQRRMPLTNKYLMNTMGMHMFKKMNKIGENTYPNMMAMLTGKRARAEQADMPLELDPHSVTKFDDDPLIWRQFAAKGYATVFNEDWTEYGLFHYKRPGFAKKPVDFYYHMFWLLADRNKKKRYCVASRPSGEVLVDIARRQLVSLKDALQFGYHFLTDYSHQEEDDVNMGDETYFEFFREMFEKGFLNKTIIFFLADHGHRFSKIRRTLIGSLEEHNPIFGIWFPEWFYKQHPHLKNVLSNNTELYASTFDVHETLKDILNKDYDNLVQDPNLKRGLSLLRPLPEQRTCKEAGVPERYCLCKAEKPIDVKNATVADAAKYVIERLNLLLQPEPMAKKCQEIVLNAILSATSIVYDQTNMTSKDNPNMLKLVLSTMPNEAIFEAVLVNSGRNSKRNNWTLVGGMERLTSYEHSGDCIEDQILRKFCTCKF